MKVLTADGSIVLEAATGEEAFAIFRSTLGIDLAILDIEMPGLSGIDVAEAVHPLPVLKEIVRFGLAQSPAQFMRGGRPPECCREQAPRGRKYWKLSMPGIAQRDCVVPRFRCIFHRTRGPGDEIIRRRLV